MLGERGGGRSAESPGSKYLPAGMEIFFISVVGVVTELKDVM